MFSAVQVPIISKQASHCLNILEAARRCKHLTGRMQYFLTLILFDMKQQIRVKISVVLSRIDTHLA